MWVANLVWLQLAFSIAVMITSRAFSVTSVFSAGIRWMILIDRRGGGCRWWWHWWHWILASFFVSWRKTSDPMYFLVFFSFIIFDLPGKGLSWSQLDSCGWICCWKCNIKQTCDWGEKLDFSSEIEIKISFEKFIFDFNQPTVNKAFFWLCSNPFDCYRHFVWKGTSTASLTFSAIKKNTEISVVSVTLLWKLISKICIFCI